MPISILCFRSYINGLSGRRLGAFKTAASKLGITFEQYIAKIESGEKNCIDCRKWKLRTEFSTDNSRWDGSTARCKKCSSQRGVDSYEPVNPSNFKVGGPQRNRPRGNDKKHARHLINLEVRTGKRPKPSDLFCVLCGHKGDDKRHEYHHHMGYSAEHVYDVVPLCSTCHGKER